MATIEAVDKALDEIFENDGFFDENHKNSERAHIVSKPGEHWFNANDKTYLIFNQGNGTFLIETTGTRATV